MMSFQRLLMASTILSGVALFQAAEAGIAIGVPEKDKSTLADQSVIMLAQAVEPEKKPEAAPPKKPAAPTAAPAPPPQKPATPPAAARPPERAAPPAATHPVAPPPAAQVPARPPAQGAPHVAPPAAQGQPPAVPGRTVSPPPAAQTKPQSVPPAAQGQPPKGPVPPVTPPAAQVPAQPPAPPAAQGAPHVAPPAAQGQPPAVPGRPVSPPPAAQTKPQSVPPAAQGQPPKGPVPPVTPPAAQVPAQPPAPPAAQGAPHVAPPAAQGQPPAVPGRPVSPPPAAQTKPQSVPPAAQGGAVPPPSAGVAPNMQKAPLLPSGVPTPSAQEARPIAPAAAGTGISPQSAQGQPLRRMEELRGERRESTEGGRTIIREPDRTIIREGGQTIIRHSEVDRFRYGAHDVRMERRGNDNVTIVVRPGGERVVTVVDENGFLLRRSRILPDGREIIIIDNRPRGPGFRRRWRVWRLLCEFAAACHPNSARTLYRGRRQASPALLYETLIAPPLDRIERRYSLDEIRYSAPLRDRMSRIDLNTITFDTGSWELSPDQVQRLATIADGLNRAIQRNPSEVFLIEGYTDAVGSDVDNLSLSDRRAESVAIALTQQFGVPAENLSTQGYGKQYLKIPTDAPERANRRVTVRRITPLLTGENQ